ncbi:hypothetical protein [Nakamurella sp. PAMC28650]|uniref:hypothetical protein n=1 Tax=Nakamurella sp. PAMC28650 TaxID=2762325 RepID=UPI00164EA5B1|nr:hypothetical protein [Nakamurella sp. PAMC28650]QNK80231.1 hypothetical protein H7F38_18795 [Nakamurella sp. PAMC28650]
MVIDPARRRHLPRSAPTPIWTLCLINRKFPLLAMLALVLVGMLTTTWGAHLIGQHAWSVPHDLWRTLVAADRVRQLDLGGLYTPPTQLVTFPGAALILVPIVAVIDGTGGNLAFQTAQNPEPAAWLLAGPYEIALSGVALFAADAIAERWGADGRARALLAGAGAVALWNVAVRFGHPEDAVAVGLLLYGILALSNDRVTKSAWLIGAGVAAQPLILLGWLVVLAVLPARKMPGFLVRTAIPGVVVLGAAALANWGATSRAVTSQPNWPTSHSNHSTPWTWLAPDVGGGAVSAGPGRIVAILLALVCAVVLERRWRGQRNCSIWTEGALQQVLWCVALALALRCVFESVMVSYYLWPVLAVALVASSIRWSRLVAGSVTASGLTFLAQAAWHGPWLWWGAMVAGLGLMMALARQPGMNETQRPVSSRSRRR